MAKLNPSRMHKFIARDIWHMKPDKFPKWQRGGIRILRIIVLAYNDFEKKDLALRSSALTLYTLLSIVPVVAMIFGIAKGFGLEAYLDQELRTALGSQPVILDNVLAYAHNLLGSTKGGVIAGFGFALLLWTILQVLGNIENAFNSIWYIQQPRRWVRKFTDYLSIMLVAPLFIIISGTANIFITTRVTSMVAELSFLGSFVTEVIIISLQILPYITTSLMFFFLYQVMPNTRVKPRSAITAGIIAGCFFQLFQWTYITFQIGVSRYNTIYGSFASIPLFITWLQLSWMIVLIGAEISYSVQNIAVFESEQQTGKISHKMRMLYSLYIMHYVTRKFKDALQPPDALEIATKLVIPINLCKQLLNNMQRCDLVAQTIEHEKVKEYSFVPALDISYLTIGFIINKLESMGEMKKQEEGDTELFHNLKVNYLQLEEAMNSSSANKHILEF